MNWYCTSRTMKGLVVAGLTCSLTTAFAANEDVSLDASKKVSNGIEQLANWKAPSDQMARKYAGLLNNQPGDGGVVSRGGVPNDDCDGAILITCGGGAVAGDNTGATDSNTTASCSFGGQLVNSDVWYKFVASDVDARVSLCGGGSLTDSVLRVFSGDCANLTEIACNDDFCGLLSEVCATGLTVGQTYYVAVSGWNTTAQGTFTIEVVCPCTPACATCQTGDVAEGEPTCGDFYVDATNGGCNSTPPVFGSLSIGQTVCGTSGTFLGTIPDPNDPNNPFVVNFRDTDWFEFTVPSRQLVTWSVTAEFPSLIFMLNAGCPATALGNATGTTCGTASMTRCLEPGTYVAFVAPSTFSGVACGAHYRGTLSATDCPPPPENDECSGAVLLTCGAPAQQFTNEFASTGADDIPSSCAFGGAQTGSNSVWFKFVASQVNANITLCPGVAGGLADSIMAVYSGSCGALTEIACNDDSCGLLSAVTVTGLNVGETYYVRVSTWVGGGALSGAFTIGLTCLAPITNDLCSGAINVAVPSSTVGTTIGATLDALPTCGTTITQPGVWYRVIGNGNSITVTTCNDVTDYDTKISVFCGTCNSLTCVGGNDDGGTADCAIPSGAFFESRVTFCSQPTAVYYVLVHGFSGVGNFQLDVITDGSPCTATVQCVATGACCIGSECVVTTSADCQSRGGSYNGDNSSCGGGAYQVSTIQDPIIDISGTGIASTAGGCDDACSENVVLPFSFPFFGSNFSDIWINANGFLSFGAASGAFGNAPIPTATAPNNIICPLWDDFNGGVQGDVYYQTLANPTRFVVMYSNMIRFAATSGANTYEVILYGDGSIEYRYGDIEGALLSSTIGIENADGTLGVSIAQADLGNGNTGRRIANVVVSSPCAAGCPLPGCVEGGIDCDFDGDCDVDLTDLAFLLINFGTPSGATNAMGDTDGNGTVDLTDLAQVLIRFGQVCH